MQFGRSYEEFEVGATYRHWPGKTVTEYDDHLFCLLTMNHHPLHLDAHYAGERVGGAEDAALEGRRAGLARPDVQEQRPWAHGAPCYRRRGRTVVGATRPRLAG